MGGIVPLGYEANGRTLAIVEEHASVIRDLFRLYREISNVRLLKEQLAANRQGEQRARKIKARSPLAGKVFDKYGEPLAARHACKGKVRYRYYVAQERESGDTTTELIRIPARELEAVVVGWLADALDDPLSLFASLGADLDRSTIEAARAQASELAKLLRSRDRKLVGNIVKSATVRTEGIALTVDADQLRHILSVPLNEHNEAQLTLDCKVRLQRTGMAMRLVEPGGRGAQDEVDRSLAELLAQARKWWERLSDGETTIAALAREQGVNDSWISRVVRLAFLSPEIVDRILAGTQPAALNGTALTTAIEVPASWNEQARLLGLT